MAQYTANYQLHQWEPQDNFLRTDFNQDFAKIDAALASIKVLADGKVSPAALAAVEALANQKCRVITGSYTGTGEYTRTISLGVRPIPPHTRLRFSFSRRIWAMRSLSSMRGNSI